jgi:hypothetical protein
MHKYMKIGKINGKRKKKRDFPANWTGGDFGPARARARQAAQLGPPAGDGTVGAGPRASEEGGNGVREAMTGGGGEPAGVDRR